MLLLRTKIYSFSPLTRKWWLSIYYIKYCAQSILEWSVLIIHSMLNMATAGLGPLSVLRHSSQASPLPENFHCLRMAWAPLPVFFPLASFTQLRSLGTGPKPKSLVAPGPGTRPKTELAASGLLHAERLCLKSFRVKFSEVYSTESRFCVLLVAILWKERFLGGQLHLGKLRKGNVEEVSLLQSSESYVTH